MPFETVYFFSKYFGRNFKKVSSNKVFLSFIKGCSGYIKH